MAKFARVAWTKNYENNTFNAQTLVHDVVRDRTVATQRSCP